MKNRIRGHEFGEARRLHPFVLVAGSEHLAADVVHQEVASGLHLGAARNRWRCPAVVCGGDDIGIGAATLVVWVGSCGVRSIRRRRGQDVMRQGSTQSAFDEKHSSMICITMTKRLTTARILTSAAAQNVDKRWRARRWQTPAGTVTAHQSSARRASATPSAFNRAMTRSNSATVGIGPTRTRNIGLPLT